jgi:hypothetical protein
MPSTKKTSKEPQSADRPRESRAPEAEPRTPAPKWGNERPDWEDTERRVLRRCKELRDELARVGRADAKARYNIGVAVNDLKDHRKRGVSLLADELGFDRKTLYKFGAVAEAWPWSVVKGILEREDAKGLPISFSHLVVVASVEDTGKRDELIDAILEERLSVRQLEARIAHPPKGAAPDDGAARAKSSEPSWFRTVRATFEPLHERVDGLEAELDALEGKAVELFPDDARRLADMLARQAEAVSRLQRVNKRLEAFLNSAAPVSSAVAA